MFLQLESFCDFIIFCNTAEKFSSGPVTPSEASLWSPLFPLSGTIEVGTCAPGDGKTFTTSFEQLQMKL